MSNIIDSIKLSGTVYTLSAQTGGVTVDPSLDSGSTNPVQNKALYDELRLNVTEQTETLLQWEQYDGGESTNYPIGCTKITVEVDENEMTYGAYTLYNNNHDCFGVFVIESNGGVITVSTIDCQSEPATNITYSINDNVVTIEYPTITNVTIIGTSYDNYWTIKAISGTSTVTPLIDQVTANTVSISGKQDTLISGTNIKTINNESILGSGNITIQGGGNPTVELTQAEYDALVTAGTVSADTYYIITDASAGDLTNYYTKTETNTLLGGKQDTLVSGTNIKTINNTSILGSGNIDIQGGGGKAIEAGRGIAITTGETADTVSFDLPIYKTVNGTAFSLVLNTSSEPSANIFKTKYNTYINCINPYVDNGSGTRNLIMGEACSAMSYASESFVGGFHTKIGDSRTFAFGSYSEALAVGAVAFGYDAQSFKPQVSKGHGSFACGGGTSASTEYSFATGYHTFTTRRSEFTSGQYNNSVSASTTFGDSGNTLFSVGNGTADNARHNAFEIRQNGDIYCSDGTNDVKLQDTITATAANTTALGGLSLVKLTQAQYDALATKDNSTLYVIVN